MSVTAAAGFSAAGIAAGIKPGGALDLAVIAADPGTVGAAVFTTNRAAAAPVAVSRAALETGPAVRGVVVNSGCANAATGEQGRNASHAMVNAIAGAIGCRIDEVLVCSTGTIGSRLDENVVATGCVRAVAALSPSGDEDAAAAILTTDTTAKTAVEVGDGYVIGGMAKGAGMIRPDMATMLAVITTDAVVEPGVLRSAVHTAVDRSFNALNVDGCASTNDTAIVLASGVSEATPDPASFARVLSGVCASLAHQIAADAEGASRVVTLDVRGAATEAVARSIGRSIADSALVRASFYGGDPNWGRILGALGTTAEPYSPDQVEITWSGVKVTAGGEGVDFDEDALAAQIAKGDFTVEISIGTGSGTARVLTTDLTPEYAVFNGERS